MERRTSNWHNDINPPSKSALSESVSYIDRMIGGGAGDRQYLRPGAPRRGNNNSRQRQPPTERFNKNVFPDKAKIPSVVDIDDANWIEARKKRFPKTNDDHLKEPGQPLCDTRPATEVVNKTHAIKSSNARPEQPGNCNGNAGETPRRKRTLFEKLMDSE